MNNIENSKIRKREDGSFLIDGRYQLDDFMESLEVGLSEKDEEEIRNITTVAGLVFFLLDRVPEEGDKVVYKNLEFEVLDMDGNRIDKLLVTRLPLSSDQDYED